MARRVHALLPLLGVRRLASMSGTAPHHQSVLNALKQSRRIRATDPPCIVQMQQMLRGKDDVISLAQGIVHWQPPAAALDAAREFIGAPETSLYCADDGLPDLRAALLRKLASKNGIVGSDVMVTQGANQAYMNLVLTLLDAGDAALLYRPYYFNHLMALQMTGSASELVLPPSLPYACGGRAHGCPAVLCFAWLRSEPGTDAVGSIPTRAGTCSRTSTFCAGSSRVARRRGGGS